MSKMQLKTNLKDFQKQTVEWMKEQENLYDGGMLLNEAGTGKTITCLSLIIDNPIKTLIVCPSGLINNWLNEIKMHTNIDISSIVIYHDKNRKTIIYNKKQFIFITSFNILSREFNNKFEKKSLFLKQFDRIIIDEAHYIRNYKSNLFKALENLNINKKWIVTATPIFNSIEDLYAYFKFLQVSCIESRSSWRQLTKSENGIVKMHELNKLVEKHSIKIKKNEVLQLPEKNIKEIYLTINDFEKDFYQALLEYSNTRLKRMITRVKNLKLINDIDTKSLKRIMCNNIIVYILRLKQCCNSPWLVINKMERLNNISSIKDAINVLDYYNKSVNIEEECPICFDKTANVILKPCGHKFCDSCIDKMTNLNIKKCAMCRCDILDFNETHPNKNLEISNDELMMSCKIKYLLELIKEKIQKNEKIVIVSQWVTMLDIVKKTVNKYIINEDKSIKTINLEGNVPLKQRIINIDNFQNNNDYKICYLSLMSSAEGINLTSCNNMVLLDSWWNESKMIQVIDRLHRIGQNKNINIYKLIIENSIEEKIKELVNYKSKIANLIINKWNINDMNKYDDNWMKQIIKLIDKKE